MTQPLDRNRKILIGLSATMMIAALGAGAYTFLQPTNTSVLQPLEPTLTTVTDSVPYQLPEHAIEQQPALTQHIQPQPMQQSAPPTQAIEDSIPASAKQILKLSEQIQLSELQTAADKAALNAKNAKSALSGQSPAPSQLDNLFDDRQPSDKTVNVLDTVSIKSLVSTTAGVTGYLAIGNELMPIKKGSRIGDIRVIDMTAQYVDLSHKGKTARKYLGS
ncbi:hypothetical protein TUM4438_40360 [Shewanella sairae]|uniref:Type IV pilus biogenesis protein PilP n=1 Tax=Shewanella sairae TaxID=190310 RepID=A0ABQ4PQC7_9GAMM|nr:hypothetical protein [Shewanella sairae]MCL1132240.1 hypothetical protein [Shewanella sairae]GIU51284.1 hypothetical protein TUM4438_40360 [Shewanella sairae]